MKPWPHTTITFVSAGGAPGHVTRSVLVNGSPVTVALGGVEMSQPASDEAQTVTLTLLPDAVHFIGPDGDTPASTETARNGDLSDATTDQAPAHPPARERMPESDPDVTARNIEALKHELETPMGEHGECCEPGERAPREDEDPDEALAKVIRDGVGKPSASDAEMWTTAARAAREHLNPDGVDWESTLSGVVQDRDAAIDRAEKAEAERDSWKARYAMFRGGISDVRLTEPDPNATDARYEREDTEARQPDPDTVTLRRDDVAALLQAVEASRLVSHISRSVTNRVRAALGRGDSDAH